MEIKIKTLFAKIWINVYYGVKIKTLSAKIWNMMTKICIGIAKNFRMPSQPSHDVERTLHGRCNDVKKLKRRRNNIVLR